MSKLERMRKCGVNKAVRTIQANEVTYNEDVGSSFISGNNLNEMTLRIIVDSSSDFLKGTKMTLKLVGYKDHQYVYYPIAPIYSQQVVVHNSTKTVTFLFQSTNLSDVIPYGTMYAHATTIEDASIRVGQVQEYCFLLYAECGKFSHNKHVIPINARYIYSEAKVNYKCEKLSTTTADEENAIPITINGNIIYFSKPHCVSHGQMKRPQLLDYPI